MMIWFSIGLRNFSSIFQINMKRTLFVAMAFLILMGTAIDAQTVRIVGLGATTCQIYLIDTSRSPVIYKDYLFWAQGYMSGILITRPPGVDEKLNLIPPKLGLADQIKFLSRYCERNRSSQFAAAVEALYKRLRAVE